ncbi:MAG: ABC transporter substrate-binding protein [Methanothrix sp.]|nr:ABC transporter substrate-binding protein [Methanothrix sp.]
MRINNFSGYLHIEFLLGQGVEDSNATVLKIGTPNVVKSAGILGDSSMGVFAHLSNPTLMKMASDGKVVGLTAKSYEVSEDGKIWKFFINDDLYWSDGEKLTPDDVRFTFSYLADNYPTAGWIKKTVDNISVEDGAVVFKLNKPHSRLNLEFATYPILARHIWEKVEKPMEYINEGENVGFGPFYIAKTDLGAGVIYFRKNPYWKGASPKFDSLEIHTFSNMDVLSLALNLQKETMSDKSFREAISCAINYSEILKLDALGYGQVPNAGYVPPSMMDFKETARLEYNLSKAKSILEGAGYKDSNGNGIVEGKDGKDIKLTFLTRTEYQRTKSLRRNT